MAANIIVNYVNVCCPSPAKVTDDFEFEVCFDCLRPLEHKLVWRLIYVGSAEESTRDQELELIELPRVQQGTLKFKFSADAPDFSILDPDDILGSTVILLEASYRGNEFVRIGWYLTNYYNDQELQDDPPDVPIIDKLMRHIIANEPRVTRFVIPWTDEEFARLEAAKAAGIPADLAFLDQQTALARINGSGANSAEKLGTPSALPPNGIGAVSFENTCVQNNNTLLPPAPFLQQQDSIVNNLSQDQDCEMDG